MLAVRYIVYGAPLPIRGFHIATRMVGTLGEENLYEADSAAPYARVVPAAIKVNAEQIPATVLLQGFDPYRIVLLDESAGRYTPDSISALPPPMAARATVTHWEPGAMTVRMNPTPEHDGYLVVSENWYTDWRATVDGRSVTPLRGQGTLLTVPVPRGSREVTLSYSRDVYRTGRLMTLLSFAVIAAWLLVPPRRRRRRA